MVEFINATIPSLTEDICLNRGPASLSVRLLLCTFIRTSSLAYSLGLAASILHVFLLTLVQQSPLTRALVHALGSVCFQQAQRATSAWCRQKRSTHVTPSHKSTNCREFKAVLLRSADQSQAPNHTAPTLCANQRVPLTAWPYRGRPMRRLDASAI